MSTAKPRTMFHRPAVSPERQAFEAWYKGSHTGADTSRTRKGYASDCTRRLWRLWQHLRQGAT